MRRADKECWCKIQLRFFPGLASCDGLAHSGIVHLQEQHVTLNVIFGVFASPAIFSIILVLLIHPKKELTDADAAAS